MLQGDRHLGMHEQMRNTSDYICVSFICPLTAEVVSSPADAHLMCVAYRHVRCQKVALVIFVVQIPGPHDVAELFRRHLQTSNQVTSSFGY